MEAVVCEREVAWGQQTRSLLLLDDEVLAEGLEVSCHYCGTPLSLC